MHDVVVSAACRVQVTFTVALFSDLNRSLHLYSEWHDTGRRVAPAHWLDQSVAKRRRDRKIERT